MHTMNGVLAIVSQVFSYEQSWWGLSLVILVIRMGNGY